MAIFSHKWLMLWRKKHIVINLSWHGGYGPLLSSFEVLEVPKTHNSSIVWRHHSKSPVPLRQSVVVQELRFPLRWNMKSSREKSNWWFPQIWWSQWVTLQLWSGFLTLCEGKNTRKPVQKWIQMHGRANQSRNTIFEHFSLSWGPLKIPHQGGRGYGSRLSIWWWLVLYLFWPPK